MDYKKFLYNTSLKYRILNRIRILKNKIKRRFRL